MNNTSVVEKMKYTELATINKALSFSRDRKLEQEEKSSLETMELRSEFLDK